MIVSRPTLLLAAAAVALAACNTTTGRAPSSVRVHAHIGYSPYWRYWGPPPVVVPPEPGIPIEPPIEPPIAVPLPIEPAPDFGGGFGGDFGGDFGGLDAF